MTDHAAEAQRHLARAQAKLASGVSPEVTALATLAIAHTLQAIHELLATTPTRNEGSAPLDPCDTPRPDQDDRQYTSYCVKPANHQPEPHMDRNGDTW